MKWSDPAVVEHLVLFITFLVTTLVTWRKAARDRKWDLEDRQILASKDQSDRARIAEELLQRLERQEAVRQEAHVELANRVEASTSAAQAAYSEANHVNLKLEKLNERLLDVAQHDAAKPARARKAKP